MRKLLFAMLLIPLIPFVAVYIWVQKAEIDRGKAERYIRSYFGNYKHVTLTSLTDFNEEFPACCPEFSAELDLEGGAIELSDLNIDTFVGKGRFFFWGIDGNRLQCRSIHGYEILGINAYNFSDPRYRELGIKSVDDVMAKTDEILKYFRDWPPCPEQGIETTSDYDGSLLRCYISKKAEACKS